MLRIFIILAVGYFLGAAFPGIANKVGVGA